MDLSRTSILRELEASKAALLAHTEGIAIHEIVIAAFEKALEKCPEEPETEEKED